MTSLVFEPASTVMSQLAVENDIPPEYISDLTGELFPPPTYSPPLGSSLCVPLCDSSTCGKWIFDTKHIRIDLGARLWNTDRPLYGLNAKVQGIVQLSGGLEHVSDVSVMVSSHSNSTLHCKLKVIASIAGRNIGS
jgi:hypothetical protein